MIKKDPCGCKVICNGTSEFLPPESMCAAHVVEWSGYRKRALDAYSESRARLRAQEAAIAPTPYQSWEDM